MNAKTFHANGILMTTTFYSSSSFCIFVTKRTPSSIAWLLFFVGKNSIFRRLQKQMMKWNWQQQRKREQAHNDKKTEIFHPQKKRNRWQSMSNQLNTGFSLTGKYSSLTTFFLQNLKSTTRFRHFFLTLIFAIFFSNTNHHSKFVLGESTPKYVSTKHSFFKWLAFRENFQT